MDLEDDVKEKPRARTLPKFSDKVQFDHVSFTYSREAQEDESREVLRDINLEVRRGEVLAIVGSSGAGKSKSTAITRPEDPTRRARGMVKNPMPGPGSNTVMPADYTTPRRREHGLWLERS